jgi:hypothetical protein
MNNLKLQKRIVNDKMLGKGYYKSPAVYRCNFCDNDYISLKDMIKHQKECSERKSRLEFERSKGEESRYIKGFK